MRYNKIRKMDISNGKGIRVSIFMQGCTFNCKIVLILKHMI